LGTLGNLAAVEEAGLDQSGGESLLKDLRDGGDSLDAAHSATHQGRLRNILGDDGGDLNGEKEKSQPHFHLLILVCENSGFLVSTLAELENWELWEIWQRLKKQVWTSPEGSLCWMTGETGATAWMQPTPRHTRVGWGTSWEMLEAI
jgi:hypothetical protein